MTTEQRPDDGPGATSIVLSLVGLSTLALTQPLLDLVGRNAAFLVAHGVTGPIAVVLFAATVVIGVPLAAGAVVLGLQSINRRAGLVVHLTLLVIIVTAGVLVVLRVGGFGARMHWAAEVALALALALALVWAYTRNAAVRRAANFSALAAPAVVLLFLLATPVRGFLGGEDAAAEPVDVPADAPPVVVVIFDELPLSSLLDGGQLIDRETYPSFAELAGDATFFRNVTGSHAETFEAIPAILSGRYSETNALPTAASHPTNIFSLLDDSYRLHALEPLTDLCSSCDAAGSAARSDAGALVRDLMVVQLHLVVPDDLAGVLPPLDVGWRDFGEADTERLDRERFRERASTALLADTPGEFLEFTRGIRASPEPTLNVIHTLLPHRPWRYLPDGRQHLGMNDVIVGDSWPHVEWAAAHGLQLHYAQMLFTDRLLGQLIEHLKTIGIYEEALVVVAADHGMSLVPGTPTRKITQQTVNDIATVPLLVKVPGQQDGTISDAPLETIDILPTILDVLGVEQIDGLDGTSAFDDAAPRSERRIIDETGRAWDIDSPQARVLEAVTRKFELFGTGGRFDLYGLVPPGYEDLLGQPVPAQLPQADSLSFTLGRPEEYADVDPSSAVVPAAVAGRVEGLPAGVEPAVVAIAVNGVVQAVTLADTTTEHPGTFRAMVPPSSFRDGANDITVFSVGPAGQLIRIPSPAG